MSIVYANVSPPISSGSSGRRSPVKIRFVALSVVVASLALLITGCEDPAGVDPRKPSFGGSTVSDQRYVAGVPIPVLTLPKASGGDGTLSYRLTPEVPGLTFSPDERTLSGIPSAANTYSMQYTVSDTDGDTDTLSFRIVAQSLTTIYWSDFSSIQRATLYGGDRHVILGAQTYPLSTAVAGNRIYWTEVDSQFTSGKIRSANLDGTDVQDLLTDVTPYPLRIALDVGAKKMYWTEITPIVGPVGPGETTSIPTGKIWRANLDGTGAEALVSAANGAVNRIALDIGEKRMYWLESSSITGGAVMGKIRRANLDGTGAQDLLTGDAIVDFSLDVGEKRMYWLESSPPGGAAMGKIRRANLDGTGAQDLLDVNAATPESIWVDIGDRKMYWIETVRVAGLATGTIRRANLDGTGAQNLLTAVPVLFGDVHVAEGKIFWPELEVHRGWTTARIRHANVDGSNATDIVTVTEVLFYAIDFALDVLDEKLYWPELVFDADSRLNLIRRANLDGSGVVALLEERNDRSTINGIALDVVRGRVYWSEGSTIRTAKLDGTGRADLLTADSTVSEIALDVVRERVYWSEGSTIRTAKLDGTGRADLLTADSTVRAIALDVVGGRVYWSEGEWNEGSTIRTAKLDGTGRADLLTADSTVHAIALDVVGGRVYWSEDDDEGSTIRTAKLDGTGRADLLTADSTVNEIALGVR